MSVTYNYTSDRSKIITRAFRIVGALGLNQSIPANKLAQGSQVLNELIQSWAGDNIFLWSEVAHSTTTGVDTITKDISALTPPILDIEKAWVVDGDADIQLEVLTWTEYQEIRDKTAAGRPSHVAFLPGTTPTLYFYPRPDAEYTVKILADCKLADYDSTVSSTQFGAYWERAMSYGVAQDLADEYGVPETEKSRLENKYKEAFKKAKSLRHRPIRDDNFIEGAF